MLQHQGEKLSLSLFIVIALGLWKYLPLLKVIAFRHIGNVIGLCTGSYRSNAVTFSQPLPTGIVWLTSVQIRI
jgi:hypothetical protein